MTSITDMRWDFIGSLDMPGYVVIRSPMSSQGVALLEDFSDLRL